MINLAISQLERVQKSQDAAKITNHRHRVDGVIDLLKRIRENDSLAPHFDAINNQSLVLLVSYLAAALRDLYRVSVEFLLEHEPPIALLTEEFKVSVAELLRTQVDPSFQVGDLLLEKKDLSFQDMHSTARAFEELAGYKSPKDEIVNDIIAAQASRHAIVHTGEIATERTVRQLAAARPRKVKPLIHVDERIVFSVPEVTLVSNQMDHYLARLIDGITEALESAA